MQRMLFVAAGPGAHGGLVDLGRGVVAVILRASAIDPILNELDVGGVDGRAVPQQRRELRAVERALASESLDES